LAQLEQEEMTRSYSLKSKLSHALGMNVSRFLYILVANGIFCKYDVRMSYASKRLGILSLSYRRVKIGA
jgi:hypothetical protein